MRIIGVKMVLHILIPQFNSLDSLEITGMLLNIHKSLQKLKIITEINGICINISTATPQ